MSTNQKNSYVAEKKDQSQAGCCGEDSLTNPQEKVKASLDWKLYFPSCLSFIILVAGILMDHFQVGWFEGIFRISIYAFAYLLVGWEVIRMAAVHLIKGGLFNEFFLMTIATFGAFYLGEYAEGVAVMLFYTIGELLQGNAVRRSRKSIRDLIDSRPTTVRVKRDKAYISLSPEKVGLGEVIQVRAGERLALDGVLLNDAAEMDTAALTGESVPRPVSSGDTVLAGMINLSQLVEVRTTKLFKDSALARVLFLVEQASSRKAKTQRFIASFAKIYTPVVVFSALGLVILPYFLIETYDLNDWLYRALVFLVISCPCALVISIPLGYFGGLGAAAQRGILFKGANYLDVMAKVDMVVFDKTGTLTEGKLRVVKSDFSQYDGDENKLMGAVAGLESNSNHPVAKAILEFLKPDDGKPPLSKISEIAGKGLSGIWEGKQLVAGNLALLDEFGITYAGDMREFQQTLIGVGFEGSLVGYFLLADTAKMDASGVIGALKSLGVNEFSILSGDRMAVVKKLADDLGIENAFGDLLPEDKVREFEQLLGRNRTVAFVGDGINDAPVLGLADVGIAMGGMGSDAAIETADVVIQDDNLSKIPLAIEIGRKTRQIVWQNIGLAFGVKAVVLTLGAFGMASLWEAVFADVGVALLAIGNALRIQYYFRYFN
ncbi:heavy metal translocating P-type ATPase [Lunatibacter salilacus]|uniref:heavy metal translocating P-type ATPase n=1 Tax=Lunatibacter salilacus TaxID=2483804 RepID=UPI00131E6FB6|nr:heavy metal translocating P-type ATPase [Lunatibacter salilacus]